MILWNRVDLSTYGSDIKPVPVAIYNNNKLIAKTVVIATAKKVYIHHSKTSFHGYISITDNGLAFDDNFILAYQKKKKSMSQQLVKVL
jgi:hypothetical protein